MDARDYSIKIAEELKSVLERTDADETEVLAQKITNARAIFVLGAGRSFLMMKAFAMRLMHIGLRVYVVGEIVTPAIMQGDLLIIGSGSGETGGLVLAARKAAELGVDIALITSNPSSTLAKAACITVIVPASIEKTGGGTGTIQPGGSSFEQSLLLLCDGVVLRLMADMEKGLSVMKRHANLE